MPDRLCVCFVLCVVWLCTDSVSSASILTVIIHRTLVLHCQYAINLKVCHFYCLIYVAFFWGILGCVDCLFSIPYSPRFGKKKSAKLYLSSLIAHNLIFF